MGNKQTQLGAESVSVSPKRILHLEDNKHDRMLLQETLARSTLPCEFVHAATRTEFEAALRQTFDVIISDFTLPAYDGMAALAFAQKIQPETPFLFLSGTIGEERAVESLKSGATDYLLKSHLGRLVPAIERALRDVQTRAERKALESQIRQLQKMEAIGQLAGGVAHDFNNLLAVIRGNVELALMREEELEEEVRGYLKEATIATERAAGLTRQLLTFGRKQAIQARALKLGEVVNDLSRMLRRLIGADVNFECETIAPVSIHADLGMIEQVLVNLVVNARDAMPQGGRLSIRIERITVTASDAPIHPEARVGDFACLTVTDTGSGIAPEHLPHIFEPFYTTKEVGKGTGLGLATVYGIIKQHNGWVELTTRVGVGTSFKVYLPAISPTTTASTNGGSKGASRGGNERILLTEDDAALRVLTRRILESFGYDVLEANSGKAALEMASANPAKIDLLLTDMVMPDGIMGRELAQRLRSQRPQLRVIYMSGYSREAADSDTNFFGKDRFLQKPFASPDLLDAVRQSLDQK